MAGKYRMLALLFGSYTGYLAWMEYGATLNDLYTTILLVSGLALLGVSRKPRNV